MSATILSERKSLEVARRMEAATRVVERLRAYAHSGAGRFVISGSFVDRRLRYDSDLDVLIDFPASESSTAWELVEDACARAKIEPDIHDASTRKPAFIERVTSKGIVLA